MKKIIYSIAMLLSVMAFYGCNPMDNEPTDRYTDKTFWSSIDKAQYMLNMAYNQLYSAGKMWNDERLSDNLFMGRGYTDQRSIRNGLADAATGVFQSEWADGYGGIKTCHVILENIDNLPADAATISYMKAQARYIRAAIYFRLTNFYGDIPFFTKDITLAESKTISRTDRQTVINFIHKELDEILPLLPKKEQLKQDEIGKITQAAALMLQARVYLYDSEWTKVEECCQKIMSGEYGSYALYPSYADLFTQEAEYNEEVIMDCAYTPATRTWGEMFDMAPISMGARVNSSAPTQALVNNYLTMQGETIEESATYNEGNPYNQRDPRLTATVIYDRYNWSSNVKDGSSGVLIYTKPGSNNGFDTYAGANANASPTGYYVRKYFDPHHEDGLASAINIITMRYADVLLMYAEAMNEQGKMTEEVWNQTIRPIRERAGFTAAKALNYPTDKAEQSQMRSVLRRERNSELALEGLRWYDIKRWQAGEEYLNGQMYGARFANSNTSYIKLDVYQFNPKRDYLFAVPKKEYDINPNLGQNPMYGR